MNESLVSYHESSATRVSGRQVSRLTSNNVICCHTDILWETNTFVSAVHIILTKEEENRRKK